MYLNSRKSASILVLADYYIYVNQCDSIIKNHQKIGKTLMQDTLPTPDSGHTQAQEIAEKYKALKCALADLVRHESDPSVSQGWLPLLEGDNAVPMSDHSGAHISESFKGNTSQAVTEVLASILSEVARAANVDLKDHDFVDRTQSSENAAIHHSKIVAKQVNTLIGVHTQRANRNTTPEYTVDIILTSQDMQKFAPQLDAMIAFLQKPEAYKLGAQLCRGARMRNAIRGEGPEDKPAPHLEFCLPDSPVNRSSNGKSAPCFQLVVDNAGDGLIERVTSVMKQPLATDRGARTLVVPLNHSDITNIEAQTLPPPQTGVLGRLFSMSPWGR